MIQRVQTIYLLLAALCGGATFFLPYCHFFAEDLKVAEYAMFGVFNVQSDAVEMNSPYTFPVWIFGALSVIIPLIGIFIFKNRPVQMRIARLGYLIDLGYVVYLFFAIDKVSLELYEGGLSILYHFGFYLPIAAIVFLFLANRGIKKDIALIKSLDRIR
jgi:hypothetical protein